MSPLLALRPEPERAARCAGDRRLPPARRNRDAAAAAAAGRAHRAVAGLSVTGIHGAYRPDPAGVVGGAPPRTSGNPPDRSRLGTRCPPRSRLLRHTAPLCGRPGTDPGPPPPPRAPEERRVGTEGVR